jgi:hypothetical protein
MQAFNIKRGRKIIDTVFYNDFPKETAADVEKALKARGEMPDDCYVTKVRRKMKDEYEIQGNYGCGWEVECTEFTRKEAKERFKEYRENAGTLGQHRIVHKRVPV